eukprot:s9966_g1.t1
MPSIHKEIGVIEKAVRRLAPAEAEAFQYLLSRRLDLVSFDTLLTDESPTEETVRTAQRLTGEILWLSQHTRPDLAFTACVLASLSTKAPQRAIRIAEKALACVQRTKALALTADADDTGLIAYSDASYAPEGNRAAAADLLTKALAAARITELAAIWGLLDRSLVVRHAGAVADDDPHSAGTGALAQRDLQLSTLAVLLAFFSGRRSLEGAGRVAEVKSVLKAMGLARGDEPSLVKPGERRRPKSAAGNGAVRKNRPAPLSARIAGGM